MRMLIVGYCMGIRSERRRCEEIHLNLAYRWFCHLGLDGKVPDHSTFSRSRHGRFMLRMTHRRLTAGNRPVFYRRKKLPGETGLFGWGGRIRTSV